MPGMMDTVLNLGLNDETAEALAKRSGDKRFAYDSYRRFITMYCDVVLGIDHHHFEELLDDHKDRNGYALDTDLEADDWVTLCGRFKERLEEEHGEPFPQDPFKQLWGAIGAVFSSWMNQRAITYRRLHNIPKLAPRSTSGQVFGNMGETSGDGVAFTRNPRPAIQLYGEFWINAQGEDVVAGIRTPQEIKARPRARRRAPSRRWSKALLDASRRSAHLRHAREALRDMQDPNPPSSRASCGCRRRVWQAHRQARWTRSSSPAHEGPDHPQKRDPHRPGRADQLLHPTIDPAAERRSPPATGPLAPPGRDVFSSDDARRSKPRANGSSGAGRPRPRTSTACTRPRASSPPAAA
jgi:pyruvate,orthophosphate dikinase